MWQKVGAELVSSSHGWFNLINAVIPVPQMAFTAQRSAPLVSPLLVKQYQYLI